MKVLLDVLKNASDYCENKSLNLEVYKDQDHIYSITYKQLYINARKLASAYAEIGIKKGDYVVFQIVDILGYLYSFWACQVLGAIPVPLSVNVRKVNNSESYNKIINVRKELKSSFVLFEDFQKELYCEEDKSICITELLKNLSDYSEQNIVKSTEEDVAFIQFSSGSTSSPKGVVLKQKNIIENMRQISERLDLDGINCCASWMPLTHDMGFIAFHLMPLKHFANSVLFSPELFARNPLNFLQVVGKLKAEIIGLSNTMIELILKISKNKTFNGLDLSNLNCILNGSEPINCKSADAFVKFFGQYGLPQDCMCYCYGMAESSLVISLSKKHDVTNIKVNQEQFYRENIVIDETSNRIIPFVGQPLDQLDVIIIDEEEKILGEGKIGEICIKGKNVMEGYLNRGRDGYYTKSAFFKTGDKGFMLDNKIAIVGRIKDIIFKNGINFYAHDLERIVIELYPDLVNKCAVVQANGEKPNMIIIFVDKMVEDIEGKFKRINSEMVKRVGFMIEEMRRVKEFPRTEGGKIQRFKLVSNYEQFI